MIRWVFAIFLGLTIFYPLLPDILARLRVGRWPGDFGDGGPGGLALQLALPGGAEFAAWYSVPLHRAGA